MRAIRELARGQRRGGDAVEARHERRPSHRELVEPPEDGVRQELILESSLPARQRLHRRVTAPADVALRHHLVGVRKPVELVVVDLGERRVEAGELRRHRRRALRRGQRERRHALHLDLGDHPERPERDGEGRHEVGVLPAVAPAQNLAGARHHLAADDGAAEPGPAEPCAVRRRRDRPRDRLTVDVAHVGQREPVFGEPLDEVVQVRPRLDAHSVRRLVDDDAAQRIETHLDVDGLGDRRERVPCTDRFDTPARRRGAPHERNHLVA